MNQAITHVVFDIGNVLIEWNPEHLYRRLIPDDEERRIFLETICTMDWNIQQDLGRTWDEAVRILSAKFPAWTDLIKAYSEQWHDMVSGEVEGTRALLEKLQDRSVPLYAITNFSSEKFNETKDRFPFLKTAFLDIVVSAEEHLVKPDHRIYETLLRRNSLVASKCYFIDDSLANVDAARKIGMSAHHFTNAATLETELTALGLID